MPLPLAERFHAWRNRLQSNAGFRDWAAAFPLTRPIARKRARALFDLCAGFVYSQVLVACVRLDLFTILSEGPQAALALAPRLGLTPDAATRLLDAAVSLDLAALRAGRYSLGGLGCAMIDNPGITAMVEHHAALYADLQDPVALLRGAPPGTPPGALAKYWAYARQPDTAAVHAPQTDAYTRLMSASQSFIVNEVLAAHDFRRHRCLLDIGGGDGTFLEAVSHQAPAIRLMLLDLPPVAAAAADRFNRAGLTVLAQGGDARTGPLPQGADIISFIRVLHDHDDAAVADMLRVAHAALPPGGTVLIAEPMSGTPGAEPVGDAYFGFYFLAMGQGRSRTLQALAALLATAGFTGITPVATRLPMLARVILARRVDQPDRTVSLG